MCTRGNDFNAEISIFFIIFVGIQRNFGNYFTIIQLASCPSISQKSSLYLQ